MAATSTIGQTDHMTTANTDPSPENRAVTIELTLDDVAGGVEATASAVDFRDDLQAARFEVLDATAGHELGEDLIVEPAFDNGSLSWCEGYVEALLLLKVHRALGHTAYLLWDLAPGAGDRPRGHVVLSSRPQDRAAHQD